MDKAPQVIRPFEERLSTNQYYGIECAMIMREMDELHEQVDQSLRLSLNMLTIREADVLLHGAPN